MNNINGAEYIDIVGDTPFEVDGDLEIQEVCNKTIEHINDGSFTDKEIEHLKEEICRLKGCTEEYYYAALNHHTDKYEELKKALNNALVNKLMNDYMSCEKGLINKCYRVSRDDQNDVIYDKILSFNITNNKYYGEKMIELRVIRVIEVGSCGTAGISITKEQEYLYEFAKKILVR